MKDSLGNCVVCGKEAGVLYPLLPSEPAFCHEHHNPKDAGSFGCDFTGPDDFDIPIDGEEEWCPPPKFTATRETFVWKDKEGNKHKLKDIDDEYLQNIIAFLGRRLSSMDSYNSAYWSEVIAFLSKEQETRRQQ